ncbi:hypothetical protein MBLNU459_g2889t1 [Dothideomycetes sp. NU459]
MSGLILNAYCKIGLHFDHGRTVRTGNQSHEHSVYLAVDVYIVKLGCFNVLISVISIGICISISIRVVITTSGNYSIVFYYRRLAKRQRKDLWNVSADNLEPNPVMQKVGSEPPKQPLSTVQLYPSSSSISEPYHAKQISQGPDSPAVTGYPHEDYKANEVAKPKRASQDVGAWRRADPRSLGVDKRYRRSVQQTPFFEMDEEEEAAPMPEAPQPVYNFSRAPQEARSRDDQADKTPRHQWYTYTADMDSRTLVSGGAVHGSGRSKDGGIRGHRQSRRPLSSRPLSKRPGDVGLGGGEFGTKRGEGRGERHEWSPLGERRPTADGHLPSGASLSAVPSPAQRPERRACQSSGPGNCDSDRLAIIHNPPAERHTAITTAAAAVNSYASARAAAAPSSPPQLLRIAPHRTAPHRPAPVRPRLALAAWPEVAATPAPHAEPTRSLSF